MLDKNIRRKLPVYEEAEYIHVRPEEMEKESFAIITRELHRQKIRMSYDHAPVILRCIHTSADFEYADSLRFSKNVIPLAQAAMLAGPRIVTDTRMSFTGINKTAVKACGGEIFCSMDDPEIAAEARLRGMTRAAVSMEHACEADLQQDKESAKPYIFAVGNAPTALLALDALLNENDNFRPALIIAVPVGFVNVIYSKQTLQDTMDRLRIPYILSSGYKGGSSIAAAIVNALLFQVKNQVTQR